MDVKIWIWAIFSKRAAILYQAPPDQSVKFSQLAASSTGMMTRQLQEQQNTSYPLIHLLFTQSKQPLTSNQNKSRQQKRQAAYIDALQGNASSLKNFQAG